MHRRPLSVALALALILALLLPVTATAQIGSAASNIYSLSAPLSGGAEVPAGDPDGFGYARITILIDSNQLCFQTSVARIEPATASHIHEGTAGVAGPVVIPLEAPGPDGLGKGCVDADGELLRDIVASPWNYYVNVHNDEYPAGAVRGQIEMAGAQPPPPAPPSWELETVLGTLSNPRGVHVAADGSIYVAVSGKGGPDCLDFGTPEEPLVTCFGMTGAVWQITDGVPEQVGGNLPSYSDPDGSSAMGPTNVATDADGNVYVITGLFAPESDRDAIAEELDYVAGLGKLYRLGDDGNWVELADIAAWEAANNPDGSDADDGGDSNPFGLAIDGDTILITDASGNSLLSVSPDGTIAPYAIFPETMVEAPDFLELPEGEMIPMQAVPTSVTIGPDGAYYVGQLTGFPFPIGGASIWRVEDLDGDGDALEAGEVTVYANGLTNVVDIEFGPDGALYAVEITRNGLLAAEQGPLDDPVALAGSIVAIAVDGHQTEFLVDSLIVPGGVAVAEDGSLYITNGTVFPDNYQMPGSLVHATQSE
jgi:hypothetical protein